MRARLPSVSAVRATGMPGVVRVIEVAVEYEQRYRYPDDGAIELRRRGRR